MYGAYKFRLYPNDLSIRKWKCERCRNELDRDINASINIMVEGLVIHYQN